MLTQRQNTILEFLQKAKQAPQSVILAHLSAKFDAISKPTLLRDLDVLLTARLITKTGKGRAVVYVSKVSNPFLFHFDSDKYFLTPQDQRDIKISFNWDVFNYPQHIFTASEMKYLTELNKKYQAKRARIDAVVLRKELERITIELSWKSSRLEGNTYSLLETETLIKDAREAVGHSKEEAIMILNHKYALDYMLKTKQQFKVLHAPKIRAIHSLLVKGLGIADNFRNTIVRITGTNYQPIDNRFQIEEAIAKMAETINGEKHPFIKAFFAAAFIAYIQPFVDGNKRTSRLIANALLLAYDWCPMSLRTLDETEYKKAVLLFYEQNSLAYFKQLFIQQFAFAVNNYWG